MTLFHRSTYERVSGRPRGLPGAERSRGDSSRTRHRLEAPGGGGSAGDDAGRSPDRPRGRARERGCAPSLRAARLNHLLTAKRYDAVVLAYSGGNVTKCTRNLTGQALVDNYRAAATAVMKISQRHGVRNVVWVKPPAVAAPEANALRASLGALYGSLPSSWRDARVIDGGKNISPGGTFHRSLPCQSWEKTAAQGCVKNSIRIGAADGVHFYCKKRRTLPYGLVAPCDTCSSGSNRYGMNPAGTRTFLGL